MGTDKAMLIVDGETLLARLAREARSTGNRVLVIGRQRPEDWWNSDVDFIVDDVPGLGPIGGLSVALSKSEAPVMMLACDMPRLSQRAIQWLVDRAEARQPEFGLAVRNVDQIEPLFSIYCPSLRSAVGERIAQGRRSLHGLIESADFEIIDAPDWLKPDLGNVNTMDEWDEVNKGM